MLKVNVKKYHKDAKLPKKAHSGDLGFDLYSVEEMIIRPNEVNRIRTGIGMKCEREIGFLLKERSGMANKYGAEVIAGVIDAEYTGEIIVLMKTIKTFVVDKGDKIAQAIPMIVFDFDINEVSELDETSRGQKGFGSSGNK